MTAAPGAAGPSRPWLVPAAAIGASLALVVGYLALGGASYKPLDVADPCKPRPAQELREREGVLQRIALSALDGSACSLRVTREELALALASPEARASFVREHHVTDDVIDRALRAALLRSLDDAERTGDLSPVLATPLRAAAERLPVGTVIAALERASGKDAAGLLGELLDRLGSQGG